MEIFQVSTQPGGAYAIAGDTINIASEKIAVFIDGHEAALNFTADYKKAGRIGRIKGTIYGSVSVRGQSAHRCKIGLYSKGRIE